jgi:hypothetical protein
LKKINVSEKLENQEVKPASIVAQTDPADKKKENRVEFTDSVIVKAE